jgi:hypothetical protein
MVVVCDRGGVNNYFGDDNDNDVEAYWDGRLGSQQLLEHVEMCMPKVL